MSGRAAAPLLALALLASCSKPATETDESEPVAQSAATASPRPIGSA